MAKEKNPEGSYNFSSTDLLIYIWNKRIPLITISFIAAVASIIASFMITPKFRSNVVLFPTTTTSISKNLLTDYYGRTTLYEIGEEEQAEQLMQILNSNEIRDKIIEKYDLLEHYEIEPDSKFPMTQAYSEYESNIKFKLTEYLSVVIDVLDKDPQIAADIANDIAALVDSVYSRMLKQRAYDAFYMVENEYNEIVEEMKVLQDSLDNIRALGINHYETQSERYNEALGRAINEGNTKAQKILEDKLRLLSKWGGTYISIRDELRYETARLTDMKKRYQEAKLELEQDLPHTFIVDTAVKAEKKAYPKKSIIVIISTIAAFFLTLITLIMVENIKRKA